MKLEDKAIMVFAVGVTLAAAAGVITGLLVLGKQALGWLKTGVWAPQSVADGLAQLGIDATTEWVGFNEILQWLPLSGGLIAGSFFLCAFIIGAFKG